MKILIVTHYFLPHVGGIEIVAYNQAKELVKRGHKVTIVSSKIGDEPEEEIMDGIKIIRLKAWNWFENKYGIPYPIFSWKIVKVMNQEAKKADIVHVHDLFYLSPFAGAIASQINKKPLVLMQHVELVKTKRPIVNLVQRLVYWTYGKYILRRANNLLVCNNKVKNWLNRKDKTFMINNGVDAELFKPANREQKIKLRKKYKLPLDKPIIIFVGRFVEKKGFDKLFEVRDKNYFILFVGDGEVPEYMKHDRNTRFIQFMPQEKLAKIYQASDVFCLPSTNEGFPLTILEAMASGLPIITSDNPGYEDYIDRRFVKLINPTPKDIKSAIKEVLNNKKLSKKMADYSRNAVVKRFSWKANIDNIEKIYKKVLKQHNHDPKK